MTESFWQMIETFRGREFFRSGIKSGMEEEFDRMVGEISSPSERWSEGLVVCYARKPTGPTSDEFTIVSAWVDIAALKAFTGGKWHEAVIPERS